MADYTHEYSDFPNTLYSLHNFSDLKDAPTSVANVIADIKRLVLEKKYDQAAQMLAENRSLVAPYMIDSTFINTLDEELRNVEIYAKSKKQALYYSDSKPDGVDGDVWIGV